MLPALLAVLLVGSPLVGTALAEKRPADRAEFELINKTYKETDPATKLQLLAEWEEKYPESDFKDDRLRLLMQTYQQVGSLPEAVATAKKVLALFPGDFAANFMIAKHTPALNSTAADVLSAGEEAASALISGGKPAAPSVDQWGQVLLTAQQTLDWIHAQRK